MFTIYSIDRDRRLVIDEGYLTVYEGPHPLFGCDLSGLRNTYLTPVSVNVSTNDFDGRFYTNVWGVDGTAKLLEQLELAGSRLLAV